MFSRICLISLLSAGSAFSSEYPFELSGEISATLQIDTSVTSAVDDMTLGLNCSWPESLYGKVGYNHPDARKLISALRPPALRFPHGVWANFYDWESDGRRITDSYVTPYDSGVKDHPELLYGFESFDTLHREIGFDALFTWNVNYDSPEKGARRLLHYREKGFKADRIELGNEIFWKTQRSEAVSTEEKYIATAKAHAAALKKIDPTIKVSVPVHWREALTNPWNLAFQEQDWFDAITVHKYIDKKGGAKEAGEALAARAEMKDMARELQQVFPGKPIWLSEWGVRAEDETMGILGTTDTWLYLLENTQLFPVVSYFQMNAGHPVIRYDRQTGAHTVTGYGAAYEVLCAAFEDAKIYKSEIVSTKIGDGMDAISAAATIKDGQRFVFAINKTNRDATLHIRFGKIETLPQFTHRAVSISAGMSFPLGEEVLQKTQSTADKITLPPLSLSLIEFEAKP